MKTSQDLYNAGADLLGVEPAVWKDLQSLSSALDEFLVWMVTDVTSQDDAACSKAKAAAQLLHKTGHNQERLRSIVELTRQTPGIRPMMQAAVLDGLADCVQTSSWFLDLVLALARAAGNRWVRLTAMEILAKYSSDVEAARVLFRDILTDNGMAARFGQDIAPMLGALIGRQEWLRDTLTTIATDKEAGASRFDAIQTLGRVWGRETWLQELLIGISSDNGEVSDWEDDPNVRGVALDTLCGLWVNEPCLIELLVGIVTNKCDDADLRQRAITILTTIEGSNGVDRGVLFGMIRGKSEYAPVRRHSIRMSAKKWANDPHLMQTLSELIHDSTEDSSVRMEAVEALLTKLGPREWLVDAFRQIPSSPDGSNFQKTRIFKIINAG